MNQCKNRVYCGTLRESDAGKAVTVYGWVARARDLGGLVFVDVRDRTGIVQCVFDQTDDRGLFEKAAALRSEFTVEITGSVRPRASVNDKIPTGRVENPGKRPARLCARRDPAVRNFRRRIGQRHPAPDLPLPRPAPPVAAALPDPAPPDHAADAQLFCRKRLSGNRDSHSDQVDSRGGARLPCALARASRRVLRPAAVAPAVQAAFDAGRL